MADNEPGEPTTETPPAQITEYGPAWAQELTRSGKEQPPPWAVQFFDAIYQVIIRAAEAIWIHFFRQLLTRFSDLGKWLTSQADTLEDASWKGIETFLKENGFANPALIQNMLRWRGLPFPVNTALNLTMLKTWLEQYVEKVGTATFHEMERNLNEEYRPTLPDVNSAIRASLIDPGWRDAVKKILRQSGLSDEHIEMLFTAAQTPYDPQVIMDLFLRGELTQNEVYERFHRMGIPESWVDEIQKTWVLIPPIQDIISMADRLAWDEKYIELGGMDRDRDPIVTEWGAKKGLSEDWIKLYWRAHWQPIDLSLAMEMMHRGVMTEEEALYWLKAQHIPPELQKKYMQIAYRVFTRVDVRRMHATGVLNDEELIKSYTDLGYDQEHAEKMAEFTKQYNAKDKKDVTASQIIKAYRNSMINRSDAKDLLLTIKYTNDYAEWVLTNADFEEGLELQTIYISAVQTRYTNNLVDDLGARTLLTKLNLPGARIDALLEKWSATRLATQKLPSKTDLDKFLKAKIIDPDTYRMVMYRLGYDYRYTDWYLQGTGKAAPAKTVTD